MKNNKKQMPVSRLTQEFYSKPHYLSLKSFTAISNYLENRNLGEYLKIDAMKFDSDSGDESDEDRYDPMNGIGVIDIFGALTYRPVHSMCGEVGMSYQDLLEDVDEMISEGAKTIILNFDSGGGECHGCFESSDELRKKCDDAGVYLVGYVDGQSCSAAYALACACDEIVSNPSSEIGSIGVVCTILNNSEAMKMEGYQRTFIYAGEDKVPFAEDGSWKKSFIEDLQANVDSLYLDFCLHVSKYTGLGIDVIKSTQAKVFSAKDALALGLVNKVMTRSEFIDYITKKHKRGNLDA